MPLVASFLGSSWLCIVILPSTWLMNLNSPLWILLASEQGCLSAGFFCFLWIFLHWLKSPESNHNHQLLLPACPCAALGRASRTHANGIHLCRLCDCVSHRSRVCCYRMDSGRKYRGYTRRHTELNTCAGLSSVALMERGHGQLQRTHQLVSFAWHTPDGGGMCKNQDKICLPAPVHSFKAWMEVDLWEGPAWWVLHK